MTSAGHCLFPKSGSLELEPLCVHTAFMILAVAEQKTALHSLRDEEGNYTKKYAAKLFMYPFVGLHPTTAFCVKVVDMLRNCCDDQQQDIITKAIVELFLVQFWFSLSQVWCILVQVRCSVGSVLVQFGSV